MAIAAASENLGFECASPGLSGEGNFCRLNRDLSLSFAVLEHCVSL